MPSLGGERSRRARAQLVALLKVQAKLNLREPYALGPGVGIPVILLVVFGFINKQRPGNVGNSGLTVIDLYIPTLMVISFIAIAISLPATLVRDREIGWLRRISTTPVHPSRLLGAQLIVDLVLAAVAVVIILVGGTAIFDARLTVSIPIFILSIALAVAELFLAGPGCRRPSSNADPGQPCGWGALLRAPLPVRVVGAACTSQPTAAGRAVVFAKRRGGAGSSLFGAWCEAPVDDPPQPGWLHARLCVCCHSVLPLGVGRVTV